MRRCAYAFRCDTDLEALRARLDAVGPWRWIERDSAYFGPYLSARAAPDPATLKVYEVRSGGLQLDVEFEADDEQADEAWRRLRCQVLDCLLPSVGAFAVEGTDTMT